MHHQVPKAPVQHLEGDTLHVLAYYETVYESHQVLFFWVLSSSIFSFNVIFNVFMDLDNIRHCQNFTLKFGAEYRLPPYTPLVL